MHLWFLIVLMILCMAAAAAEPWLRRALAGAWCGRLLESRAAVVVWTAATLATLLPMQLGILDTPDGFVPQPRVVLAYAVFFVFGWGLYSHRERLGALQRFGAGSVAGGAVCAVFAAGAVERQVAVQPQWNRLAHDGAAVFTAMGCWLSLLGLAGIALRRLSEESPRWRYVSDAAYWVYLFHPPVLVAAQIPMLRFGWPAEAKFLAGIAFAVPVLFWTYGRRVRGSWLGALLNGRRMEGGFPRRHAGGARAACAVQ